MKAIICRELTGLDAIEVADVPSPPLGPGEARIAVRAAGVNFPDILMMEGKYQIKPPLPFTPGLEVAGEVVEIGEGVADLRIGQRVLAFARSGGGFAEEAVLPADIVTPIPDSMCFETAAAFPVAYGTAHFALAHRGALQAGETLVVLGAAGGVGIAAIEIGKVLGARVIAAARGRGKLEIAREHGADETIDYAEENLRDRLKELTRAGDSGGVDVVFDPVGGSYTHDCVRAMGWEGRLLVVGFAAGDIPKVPANLILVKNFSMVGVVFGAHSQKYPRDSRERWTRLFRHVESGALNPRVFQAMPLEQARQALEAITTRRVTGKVVLTL